MYGAGQSRNPNKAKVREAMEKIGERDFLLVVDMQNAYLPGNPWGCSKMKDAIQYTLQMIDKFPKTQAAFARFLPPDDPQGTWKEYNQTNKNINRNAWMNEFVEELKPYIRRDNTYSKSVYSCCENEELYQKLRQYERIFVTGVVAECCVLSTVLDLVDMGKKVVYLQEGIAGESRKKEEEVVSVLKGMSPVHILFR